MLTLQLFIHEERSCNKRKEYEFKFFPEENLTYV